jgi:hypothetical protein
MKLVLESSIADCRPPLPTPRCCSPRRKKSASCGVGDVNVAEERIVSETTRDLMA